MPFLPSDAVRTFEYAVVDIPMCAVSVAGFGVPIHGCSEWPIKRGHTMKRFPPAWAFILVAGALAACSSSAAAQTVPSGWTQRLPPPRHKHAMAYDAARGVPA